MLQVMYKLCINVQDSNLYILVQPFNGWNIRFITSANIIAYERILTSGGATKADKLKWKDLGDNLDDLFHGITHVITLRKESFDILEFLFFDFWEKYF